MARVFVVDDDPVLCRLARYILEGAGHHVRVMTDGQEALDALEQQVPDVLITDLMMPRLDGVALVRRIRADERWRNLSVVVFTARSEVRDRHRAEEAGASHFLTKPFNSAQLLEVVRRFAPPESSA
jgi:CheY-like chemotaxis protein